MSEASEAEPIKVGFFMDYLSGGTDDWSNYSNRSSSCSERGTRPS